MRRPQHRKPGFGWEPTNKKGGATASLSVTTLTVKPDRFEDYLEYARQTKAVMEKCGARNIRLLAALVAGEATGSLVFSWEADGPVASATVVEKVFADPEGLALAMAPNTSSGPIASYQQTIWGDVPL